MKILAVLAAVAFVPSHGLLEGLLGGGGGGLLGGGSTSGSSGGSLNLLGIDLMGTLDSLLGTDGCGEGTVYIYYDMSPRAVAAGVVAEAQQTIKNYTEFAEPRGGHVRSAGAALGMNFGSLSMVKFNANPPPEETLYYLLRKAAGEIDPNGKDIKLILVISDTIGNPIPENTLIAKKILELGNGLKALGVEITIVHRAPENLATLRNILPKVASAVSGDFGGVHSGMNPGLLLDLLNSVLRLVCNLLGTVGNLLG